MTKLLMFEVNVKNVTEEHIHGSVCVLSTYPW